MITLLVTATLAAAPAVPPFAETRHAPTAVTPGVRVAQTVGLTSAAVAAGAVTGALVGFATSWRPCVSLPGLGSGCAGPSSAVPIGAGIGGALGLLSSPWLFDRLGVPVNRPGVLLGMAGGLAVGAALCIGGELLIMHAGPEVRHAAGGTLVALGAIAALVGPAVGNELGLQRAADDALQAGVAVSDREATLTLAGRF